MSPNPLRVRKENIIPTFFLLLFFLLSIVFALKITGFTNLPLLYYLGGFAIAGVGLIVVYGLGRFVYSLLSSSSSRGLDLQNFEDLFDSAPTTEADLSEWKIKGEITDGVTYTFDGRPVHIVTSQKSDKPSDSDADAPTLYLSICIETPEISLPPINFSVHPYVKGLPHSAIYFIGKSISQLFLGSGRLFGQETIETGDPHFDRRFLVTTDSDEQKTNIKDFLTDERNRQAVEDFLEECRTMATVQFTANGILMRRFQYGYNRNDQLREELNKMLPEANKLLGQLSETN
ncbi:MAG: hypothetical protein ABEK50_13445 [bacterium]